MGAQLRTTPLAKVMWSICGAVRYIDPLVMWLKLDFVIVDIITLALLDAVAFLGPIAMMQQLPG